jgi:hypothetical protein
MVRILCEGSVSRNDCERRWAAVQREYYPEVGHHIRKGARQAVPLFLLRDVRSRRLAVSQELDVDVGA